MKNVPPLNKLFASFLVILLTSALNSKTSLDPEATLANMSLREKIGQMFVVAAASNFAQPTEQLASILQSCPYDLSEQHVSNLIKNYQVGGVIFLFKSDPFSQINFTQKYQALAKTPLLFAQDCEWGLSMRLDLKPEQVIRYPKNLTLGAITNPNLIYQVGQAIGEDCAAIGVYLNLGPVVDVNNNQHNPVIHDRSFGDDPVRVALLATQFTKGLQASGVLACAKHFPGHGDTNIDSHFNLPVIKHAQERFDQIELVPFKALISAGVDGVMLAHLDVPSLDHSHTPASLSPKVVTDLLQRELGFTGLIITDGLGMNALAANYAPGELELAAFLAGNDLLLCPLNVPRAIDLIEQAIYTGKSSEQELDRRVLKILHAKAQVAKKQICQKFSQPDLVSFLTRPAAQALQEQAYRAAITLVPACKLVNFSAASFANSTLIQIGSLAQDHFAKSCAKYAKTVFPYPANFTTQDLNTCLEQTKHSPRVVIAIGELNKSANQDFGIANNTRKLIAQLQQNNQELILMLFGTPYAAGLFKDTGASIIVAYEDVLATQMGVIDILRGVYQPTGVLPVRPD